MITLNAAQTIYATNAQLIDSQIDAIARSGKLPYKMRAMLDVKGVAQELGFTATVSLIEALDTLPYATRIDFWFGLIRDHDQRCF